MGKKARSAADDMTGRVHNPFKSWSPVNIPFYAGALDESSYNVDGSPYVGRHAYLGQYFTTNLLWTPDYHLLGRSEFGQGVEKGTRVGWSLSLKEVRHRPLLYIQRELGAKYVVIQMHGNGYDIGLGWDQAIKIAASWQCNVILPEYPGYGEAPGHASVKDVEWAVMSAALFVIAELKVPPEKIIVFGFSIGTGAACKLARSLCEMDRPPAALILHAPFTSLREESVHFLKLMGAGPCCSQIGHITFNRFKTKRSLPYITTPVLILHGDQDEIVPYWMGVQNYKARDSVAGRYPTEFLQLVGCTHNEFNDEQHIIQPCLGFLTRHVKNFQTAPLLRVDTYPPHYNHPPEELEQMKSKTLRNKSGKQLVPVIGCMCMATIVELLCGSLWLGWRGVKRNVVKPICPTCIKKYELHIKGVERSD